MIEIIYHRPTNHVHITGHARSGEAGHDLVCASTSILAYTLASFVKNMEESGLVKNNTVTLESGEALIACHTPSKFKAQVTLAFDTICAGFELLERNYPCNVTYRMIR